MRCPSCPKWWTTASAGSPTATTTAAGAAFLFGGTAVVVLIVLLGVQVLAGPAHAPLLQRPAGQRHRGGGALAAGRGDRAGLGAGQAADVRAGPYTAAVALAQARIAGFDAKAAENLTLINRGAGASRLEAAVTFDRTGPSDRPADRGRGRRDHRPWTPTARCTRRSARARRPRGSGTAPWPRRATTGAARRHAAVRGLRRRLRDRPGPNRRSRPPSWTVRRLDGGSVRGRLLACWPGWPRPCPGGLGVCSGWRSTDEPGSGADRRTDRGADHGRCSPPAPPAATTWRCRRASSSTTPAATRPRAAARPRRTAAPTG